MVLGTAWNDVSRLVERKVRLEHLIVEPRLAERVQKSLVEIIGNATAILDLSEHVSDTCPVDTLQTMPLAMSGLIRNIYASFVHHSYRLARWPIG